MLPVVQVAAAVHVPHPAVLPSVHRTPVRALHAVALLAAVQTSQVFIGFTAPSAQQAPAMRQPADTGNVQFPVVSSQVSPVHESPSLHVVLVAHVPDPLQTPHPDGAPSLHRTPTRALQAVAFAAGSHVWQGFAGLTVPAE